MGQVQVVERLHFHQPADRSVELEYQALPRVNFGRRPFGGHDELHVAVVKFVDERDEPSCLIFVPLIEPGNTGNDNRLLVSYDYRFWCSWAR